MTSDVDISIVMPVFDTGVLLEQAIVSVLSQQPLDGAALPTFELLVVDDHSTDPTTLEIIEACAARDPRVRALRNARSKGVAGARNTGIVAGRGRWIGFLDSDDWWLPHALAVRWRFIAAHPQARWVAAHFLLHTEARGVQHDPLSQRSPTLYSLVRADHERGLPTRLAQPVDLFSKHCAVGIHTVLVAKALIEVKGLFDESLRRSEDYRLWLQCAVNEDLWYLPDDIAVYRLRPGSLTRSDAPAYLHEDRMLQGLIDRNEFAPHRALLRRRIDFVLQDHCYFYRNQRRYREAAAWACRWIATSPLRPAAWKELAAAVLHR
jgi:glycosyltransferase involved in cell wall biosynthesis